MKRIFSTALILLLAGCIGTGRTPQSKFYGIRPVSQAEEALTAYKGISIGIEEVKVPAYMDKPQIVTERKNSPELNISELNRWSEPLSSMLQRTIADDMAVYLPRALVKPKNYGREIFDYTVFVEINKFGGIFGENAVLEAWWSVSDKNGRILAREQTYLTVPLGDGYEVLVEKQSLMVGEFSKQIAEKIIQLQK